MAINDKKVRDLSIEYMKRTVDTAHSIYSKSAQNTSLDLVIKGSTYFLKAFALARVVLILLCAINEQAIFDNIALLCAVFLLK